VRVLIESTTDGELQLPPDELLDKLEDAFVKLGGQLLKGARREHGEVDALAELYETMQQQYAARLRRLREELIRSA
jgi:hypothetical protein